MSSVFNSFQNPQASIEPTGDIEEALRDSVERYLATKKTELPTVAIAGSQTRLKEVIQQLGERYPDADDLVSKLVEVSAILYGGGVQ